MEASNLERPEVPKAFTRSSTARVDTPCTQASWITATSTRPAVRLEERSMIAAGPELGYGQIDGVEPAILLALAIAVALGQRAELRLPLVAPVRSATSGSIKCCETELNISRTKPPLKVLLLS